MAHERNDPSQLHYEYESFRNFGSLGKDEIIPDDELQEQIQAALMRDCGVSAHHVHCDVANGVVYLRGRVDDRRQRRFLKDLVELMPGVREVQNEIEIKKSLFELARESLFGERSSPGGNYGTDN